MTHSYSPHPLCLRVELGFTHRFFISFPFRSGGTRYFLKKHYARHVLEYVLISRLLTLLSESFVPVSSEYNFNVSWDDFNQV